MNSKDELSELWIGQPTGKLSDGEEVMEMVQKKLREFNRAIVVRNVTECLAAGIVSILFAWQGVKTDNLLTRTSCLIVATAGLWIVFYLLRYGRPAHDADPARSLAEYAQALVEGYDRQIRLLKSVKYWYLLPMYVGLLVGSIGFFVDSRRVGSAHWTALAVPAFYTLVFAGIWWLNEVLAVGRLRRERERVLTTFEDAGDPSRKG